MRYEEWPVTRRGPSWPVARRCPSPVFALRPSLPISPIVVHRSLWSIACFGSSAVLLRSLVSSMVVTLLLALCTLLDVPLTAESQRREYIQVPLRRAQLSPRL